jgi:hypothetical protein
VKEGASIRRVMQGMLNNVNETLEKIIHNRKQTKAFQQGNNLISACTGTENKQET